MHVYRNPRKTQYFFFGKKYSSSLVSTSTASASSVNTMEQTARDEPEVEVLPLSHPIPPRAKKTCHAQNLLDRMIANKTEEIKKIGVCPSSSTDC